MIDRIDHGAVRELRLNRPPANALSPDLVPALCAVLSAVKDIEGHNVAKLPSRAEPTHC